MKTGRGSSSICRSERFVQCLVPLLLSTLIAACGGGGGGDGSTGTIVSGGGGPAPVLTDRQAQTAVVDAVTFGLGSATKAASRVTANAGLSKALTGLGAVVGSAATGATVTTTTGSTANDSFNTGLQQALNIVAGSMGGFARVGNTNVYVSSLSADFCDNIVMALSDGSSPTDDAKNRLACAGFVLNVTAELTVIDQTHGTIAIKYQGETVVTLQYAPDSSIRTVDLATAAPAYAALASLMDPAVTVNLPGITGSIMFTDSVNGTVSSSIGNTAIAVNGNGFSTNLAAAPQLIKTTVDESTGVTTLDMNIPAIAVTFPLKAADGSTQAIVVSTPGMTANANFNENAESMTVSNIRLPLTVTQAGQPAFDLTMDPLALAVDTGGLAIPGGMNIVLGGAGTGQTTFSALPNTSLGSVEVPTTGGKSTHLLRVNSGGLSSSSSSDPSSNVSLTPGCWDVVKQVFTAVTCP